MRKFTIAASVAALTVASAAFAAGHGMKPMGDMTRAQAQTEAEAKFARMDLTKDGLLNQADREAHMGMRFDMLDTDSNGAISREEFMSAHKDMSRHHMGDKAEDKADLADGGKDAMHRGHKRGGWRHGGGHMMKEADTNNDGAISSAEFIAARLAMFDKADANKDGTVTDEERRAMFKDMRGKWKEHHDAAATSE